MWGKSFLGDRILTAKLLHKKKWWEQPLQFKIAGKLSECEQLCRPDMNMIIQGWEIQGSKEKRAKRSERDCECSAKIKFFLEFNPTEFTNLRV